MSISLICVALLALLVIGLGFRVSLARRKSSTSCGNNEDPTDPLFKAIRAHGNSIEYAPMLALLIYILGTMPVAAWVTLTMCLATFFRYMLVVGLLYPPTMAKSNKLRFIGALGTYVTGFLLILALFMQAL